MKPGDRVRYVPGHANGDAWHPDCEDGTVSSLGADNVRVRLDRHVERLGWDGATAQACWPGDLRHLPLTDSKKENEMSGGSFNHAYFSTAEFADELEGRLAEDETDKVARDTEVTARLTRLVREARRLAALMKEAEWFYSDDIGEETFMKRVAQIEADHGG